MNLNSSTLKILQFYINSTGGVPIAEKTPFGDDNCVGIPVSLLNRLQREVEAEAEFDEYKMTELNSEIYREAIFNINTSKTIDDLLFLEIGFDEAMANNLINHCQLLSLSSIVMNKMVML